MFTDRFLEKIPDDLSRRVVLTNRMSSSGPVANGGCSWPLLDWQSWWQTDIEER